MRLRGRFRYLLVGAVILSLLTGGVTLAESRRPAERLTGSIGQTVMVGPGVTLKLHGIGNEAYAEGKSDEAQPMVALSAEGAITNRSGRHFDVAELQLWLEGEGFVARSKAVHVTSPDGRMLKTVAPGQTALVQVEFQPVPVHAGAPMEMRVMAGTPTGGGAEALGITIRIECTYPPLRCKVTIEITF